MASHTPVAAQVAALHLLPTHPAAQVAAETGQPPPEMRAQSILEAVELEPDLLIQAPITQMVGVAALELL